MSLSSIKAGSAYIELVLKNDKLNTDLNKIQKTFSSLADVGKAASVNLSLIAAPIGVVAKRFADFDDQMRLVQAVSGETGKGFERLTEQAKKLGRETSFSASQVAGGMAALGRMGFSGSEISTAIADMMNLSRATGTELPEAAEIASNAIRAFGLQTSDAGKVADILTATANGSAQTLHDLGESLTAAAPSAKTAGESIADVNAALGVLANVGIRGSIAGNALKRAYSELSKTDVQSMLRGVGVEAVDANGNLRRLADILRDVSKVMATMGNAERIGFATQIFGERAAGSALAITGDMRKIDDFLARLKEASGEAQRQAAGMDAGIGGQFRIMASAVEGAALELGNALVPALQSVTSAVTELMGRITAFIKNHGTLLSALTKGITLALTASASIYAIGKAGTAAAIAIAAVNKAVVALKVHGFVASMSVATLATRTFEGAVAGLAKALGVLYAHPVIAGIAAALAVVAGTVTVISRSIRKNAEEAQRIADAAEDDYNRVTRLSESHRQKREGAGAAFATLQSLSEASQVTRLTSSEIETAVNAINALKPFGSESWAHIDRVAGKINIATDALKRMRAEMQKQAQLDAEAEIASLDAQEAAVRNQMSTYGGWRDTGLNWWGIADTSAEYNAPFEARLVEIRKKQVAAYQRLVNAKRGDTGESGSATSATERAASVRAEVTRTEEEIKKIDKEIADYEKKISDGKLTAMEREINLIDEETSKYKQQLGVLLEIAKSGKMSPWEREYRLGEINRKLAWADTDADARKNAIRAKATKDALADIAGVREGIFRTDSTQKVSGSVSELSAMAVAAKAAITAITRQIKNALTAAATADSDGVVRFTDSERSGIENLKKQLERQQNRSDAIQDALTAARGRVADLEEQRKSLGSAYGSFSGKEAIQSFFTSPEERTARASEKTNEMLKETNRILRRQNGTVNMSYV